MHRRPCLDAAPQPCRGLCYWHHHDGQNELIFSSCDGSFCTCLRYGPPYAISEEQEVWVVRACEPVQKLTGCQATWTCNSLGSWNVPSVSCPISYHRYDHPATYTCTPGQTTQTDVYTYCKYVSCEWYCQSPGEWVLTKSCASYFEEGFAYCDCAYEPSTSWCNESTVGTYYDTPCCLPACDTDCCVWISTEDGWQVLYSACADVEYCMCSLPPPNIGYEKTVQYYTSCGHSTQNITSLTLVCGTDGTWRPLYGSTSWDPTQWSFVPEEPCTPGSYAIVARVAVSLPQKWSSIDCEWLCLPEGVWGLLRYGQNCGSYGCEYPSAICDERTVYFFTMTSCATSSVTCEGDCTYTCTENGWELAVSSCRGGWSCGCYDWNLPSCTSAGVGMEMTIPCTQGVNIPGCRGDCSWRCTKGEDDTYSWVQVSDSCRNAPGCYCIAPDTPCLETNENEVVYTFCDGLQGNAPCVGCCLWECGPSGWILTTEACSSGQCYCTPPAGGTSGDCGDIGSKEITTCTPICTGGCTWTCISGEWSVILEECASEITGSCACRTPTLVCEGDLVGKNYVLGCELPSVECTGECTYLCDFFAGHGWVKILDTCPVTVEDCACAGEPIVPCYEELDGQYTAVPCGTTTTPDPGDCTGTCTWYCDRGYNYYFGEAYYWTLQSSSCSFSPYCACDRPTTVCSSANHGTTETTNCEFRQYPCDTCCNANILDPSDECQDEACQCYRLNYYPSQGTYNPYYSIYYITANPCSTGYIHRNCYCFWKCANYYGVPSWFLMRAIGDSQYNYLPNCYQPALVCDTAHLNETYVTLCGVSDTVVAECSGGSCTWQCRASEEGGYRWYILESDCPVNCVCDLPSSPCESLQDSLTTERTKCVSKGTTPACEGTCTWRCTSTGWKKISGECPAVPDCTCIRPAEPCNYENLDEEAETTCQTQRQQCSGECVWDCSMAYEDWHLISSDCIGIPGCDCASPTVACDEDYYGEQLKTQCKATCEGCCYWACDGRDWQLLVSGCPPIVGCYCARPPEGIYPCENTGDILVFDCTKLEYTPCVGKCDWKCDGVRWTLLPSTTCPDIPNCTCEEPTTTCDTDHRNLEVSNSCTAVPCEGKCHWYCYSSGEGEYEWTLLDRTCPEIPNCDCIVPDTLCDSEVVGSLLETGCEGIQCKGDCIWRCDGSHTKWRLVRSTCPTIPNCSCEEPIGLTCDATNDGEETTLHCETCGGKCLWDCSATFGWHLLESECPEDIPGCQCPEPMDPCDESRYGIQIDTKCRLTREGCCCPDAQYNKSQST